MIFNAVLGGVPPAPTSLEMPQTAEVLFLALSLVLLVGVIVYGVIEATRDHDATLLLCALGGAAAALFEPVVGYLGLMYLPEKGAMGTFTFVDRTMPLFVITAYAGYIGGLTYVCYRQFKRGLTVKGVYILWAVLAAANVAFETPAVLLDVYRYYGHQPLNPWGFPLWWSFVNPLTSMIAAAVIYNFDAELTGVRRGLIVPLTFAAAGAANGASAAPMWLTLNSDLDHVWTTVAAVITLSLAVGVVYVIARAVTVSDEQERGSATPARVGRPFSEASASASA